MCVISTMFFPYPDLQHCYNEIPFIQEFRPLTICRSLTSLWLILWDEKQRKKAKFDLILEKIKKPFWPTFTP